MEPPLDGPGPPGFTRSAARPQNLQHFWIPSAAFVLVLIAAVAALTRIRRADIPVLLFLLGVALGCGIATAVWSWAPKGTKGSAVAFSVTAMGAVLFLVATDFFFFFGHIDSGLEGPLALTRAWSWVGLAFCVAGIALAIQASRAAGVGWWALCFGVVGGILYGAFTDQNLVKPGAPIVSLGSILLFMVVAGVTCIAAGLLIGFGKSRAGWRIVGLFSIFNLVVDVWLYVFILTHGPGIQEAARVHQASGAGLILLLAALVIALLRRGKR